MLPLSAIPGFSEVFSNSHDRPENDSELFVVSGPAGCGKTTLALQFACSIVNQNNENVLFLNTEGSYSDTVAKIQKFHLLPDTQISDLNDVQQVQDNNVPKLLIASCIPEGEAANEGDEQWLQCLLNDPNHVVQAHEGAEVELPNHIINPDIALSITAIVIDGASQFLIEIERRIHHPLVDGQDRYRERWRELLRILRTCCRRDKVDIVLTVEDGTGNKHVDVEEAGFAADFAVDLAFADSKLNRSGQPISLSVRKARELTYFKGPHEVVITTNNDAFGPTEIGFNVVPSLACQAASISGLVAAADPRLYVGTGIDRLDYLLGPEGGIGVEPNSVVGIISEHGAGATIVALHYLAHGIEHDEGSVFLLCASHDENSIRREIESCTYLENHLMHTPEVFGTKYIALDQVSPTRLLNFIRGEVEGRKIRRLVIDSITKLKEKMSFDVDMTLFLRCVKGICIARNCSLFLTESIPEGTNGTVSDRCESLHVCENVLVLSNLNIRGKAIRALQIFRRSGREGTAGPFELARVRSVMPTTQYNFDVLSEVFESYTDVFSGYAKYIPLRLWLYVDCDPSALGIPTEYGDNFPFGASSRSHELPRQRQEDQTSPLVEHKLQLVSAFTGSLPGVGVTMWGPKEHGKFGSGPDAWGRVPRPDTVVVEFDGYWIQEADASERVIDLKSQINMIHRPAGHGGIVEPGPPGEVFLRGFVRGVESNYRTPHYLDFGMLFQRCGSIEEAIQAQTLPTWQSIANHVIPDASLPDWLSDKCAYDFDRTTGEMFSVVLLELLLASLQDSVLAEPNPHEDFGILDRSIAYKRNPIAEDTTGPRTPQFQDRLVFFPEQNSVRAIVYRQAVLRACVTLNSLFPIAREVRQYISSANQCNRKAKFQRHWFSTFGKQVFRNRQEGDVFRVFYGLPAFIAGELSPAIVGTWHLGVAKGSASPSLGAKAIMEMTSREADLSRFVANAGLPAGHWFYENTEENCFPYPAVRSPSPKMIREFYLGHGFSRAWIVKYREISLVLQGFTKDILLNPKCDQDWLERRCRQCQSSINSIYN